MRFCGAAFLAALALLQAGFAAGQPADLSRLTCGQFLDLPPQDGERLIVWLHGHYAGAAQRTGLDGRQFEAAAAAIRAACDRDRAMPLIGAEARGIFVGTSTGTNLPVAERPAASGSRPAGAPERRPSPLPSR
jgi:hypothetical protein